MKGHEAVAALVVVLASGVVEVVVVVVAAVFNVVLEVVNAAGLVVEVVVVVATGLVVVVVATSLDVVFEVVLAMNWDVVEGMNTELSGVVVGPVVVVVVVKPLITKPDQYCHMPLTIRTATHVARRENVVASLRHLT